MVSVFRFPSVDDVVLDALEDIVQGGAWVATWWAEDDERPGVLVTRVGMVTDVGACECSAEFAVTVCAVSRVEARVLARVVAEGLLGLAGCCVRGVLVDDVVETSGFQMDDSIDDSVRTESGSFMVTFRQQFFDVEG